MSRKLIEHYENKAGKTALKITESHSSDILEAKDYGYIHDTYQFENTLISYIRDGEVDRLQKLFEQLAENADFNIGVLADDPLRQAKNMFIGLVAIVGKVAGIPGGMEIEEAYRLIDIYTQECEKCSTVEEVTILQYNMNMDFARRVRQHKLPKNISPEIFEALQFISNNSNNNIGIDDISKHIGISRAYLTKRFRQEMNQSVVEYVTSIRIRDAKRFLRYTAKPLAEIAVTLGYSSQSYFQTVFRKGVGMTPKQYRNQYSKI